MRPRRDLPLGLRLLWRRLRSPEGRLAPLAVLSIAISVTLATGLEMSSRSAQRQLEETAAAITGAAQIEVVAGEVGLPESLLEVVKAVPGVRAASPMVSLIARIADRDLALNIVGVDLLAEEEVRRTTIERQGLEVRDPLRLLATPNAVVVTRRLLDRLELADRWDRGEPTEIHVRTDSGQSTLVVQALLEASGIAAAFDGQIAVMDVYAAQVLAKREGLFDRIDVVARRDQPVATVIERLNATLTKGAVAQPSEWQTSTGKDLLELVRRTTFLFAAAAAVVAGLLSYATTVQWVERQRRQLATLRAVGMEAERVRRSIFSEIFVLAVLGTALGIAGGVLVSPPVLSALSDFLEVAGAGEIERLSIEASTVWVAGGVGLVGGLAGAVLPARRASTRFTLDALESSNTPRAGGHARLLLGALGLLVFVGVAVGGGSVVTDGAMLRLASMFAASIVSLLALSRAISSGLGAAVRSLESVSPLLAHLGCRSFRMQPWTFGIALVAITVLCAALVASFLLIETIGASYERLTEERYADGILVTASSPAISSVGRHELLTPTTMETIRATSGIAAVAEHYRNQATVLFRGRAVRLNASTMDVVAERAGLAAVGRPSAELARDLAQGAVAISTGFARTFGVSPGADLELDTPAGPRRFRVAGLVQEFTDAGGAIVMDLRTFDSCWQRPGAWSASIWIDGPSEPVLDGLRTRVGASQDLFFTTTSELAALNRQGGEMFRGVLQTLGAFLALLGGLGVMILQVGIVAERRRDWAVLRAGGAEPAQLLKVVLWDACLLGGCGGALGLAIGLACAPAAADVLRESWGWVLEQRWFAREVPVVLVGAALAALVGALLPARMASATPPSDVFGPE